MKKIIHIIDEGYPYNGVAYRTHSFRPPNLSKKKKQRRRPDRRYIVEWHPDPISSVKWKLPPKKGWHSLVGFETIEVIFTK